MKAYNQKIIETPTYLEIYDYEAIITPKQKSEKCETNPKRKQKYYQNMRFEIARLVDMNFDNQTKFLTLTFRENIQDIAYANNEFKKFIKRLNYELYHTKKANLKYLATWEKQERGAIHYHIILFDFPFISVNRLTSIWGHGFVKINKIDVDSIENRGRYISKYFDKDLDMKEHKKKAFFKSRNLKVPSVTKQLVEQPFDTTNQDLLYTNEYLVRRPIFYSAVNKGGHPEQVIDFQESIVRYTKIKKMNLESS